MSTGILRVGNESREVILAAVIDRVSSLGGCGIVMLAPGIERSDLLGDYASGAKHAEELGFVDSSSFVESRILYGARSTTVSPTKVARGVG